jgi:DNA-binding protein Fis
MEAEQYKDGFRRLLMHFECLFRRGALDQAAQVCQDAIERIEQAGSACHAQMIELWKELLTLVTAQLLTDQQVLVARQYLVRHWNAPARHGPLVQTGGGPVFSSPRVEPPRVEPPRLRPVTTAPPPDEPTKLSYAEALERYDRELVAAALAHCGGRLRETARLLRVSRNTLRAKLKKHDLATNGPGASPSHRQEADLAAGLKRLRTRAWWAELKSLPPGQRRQRLETVAALQTRELLAIMLEEASLVVLIDPRQSEEFARLSCTVAGLLPESSWTAAERNDFEGEALVIAANSRRLVADWQGAATTLEAARRKLERGTGAPARAAELLSIEASLAIDTSNVEHALRLSAHAAVLYREADDPAGVTAMAVKEAAALLSDGRYEDAVARADEVMRSLPVEETRLALLARSIVTEGLVFLGRAEEALHSLAATLPLHQQNRSPRGELQLGYLEALLLDALGFTSEAESVFEHNAAALLELGLYKSAFQTLLTQVETLVRRGEQEKAAQVCEQAIERFEAIGLAGDAPLEDLWRNLLALARDGRLTQSRLREACRSLVHKSDPSAMVGTVEGNAAEAEPPARHRRFEVHAPPDAGASLAEHGYKEALERYDLQLVSAGLAWCKGRIGEAAELLGLPRERLRAKLERFFLSEREE